MHQLTIEMAVAPRDCDVLSRLTIVLGDTDQVRMIVPRIANVRIESRGDASADRRAGGDAAPTTMSVSGKETTPRKN